MLFNFYEVQNYLFFKMCFENFDVFRKMWVLIDKYDVCMMVGEVGEVGWMIDIMVDYMFGGDKLYMVYFFEFFGL